MDERNSVVYSRNVKSLFQLPHDEGIVWLNVQQIFFGLIHLITLFHWMRFVYNALYWAAKSFVHLRLYLRFFSGLIANSNHFMLVISNVKPKDHDLKNIYFTKLNYSRQQNYSSTCDNTYDFSLVWLSIFIISCLF